MRWARAPPALLSFGCALGLKVLLPAISVKSMRILLTSFASRSRHGTLSFVGARNLIKQSVIPGFPSNCLNLRMLDKRSNVVRLSSEPWL